MPRPLFIAFYPSDWRAGVANLSTVERALYHEICMVIWETGKGVKEADIYRLLRDDTEVLHDALQTLIRFEKLVKEGDELVNRRAMEEHENALNRKEAGKKGAAGRWQKDATALRPQCDGMQSAYANQTPEVDLEPETRNQTTPRNTYVPPAFDFDAFKAAYPKRKGAQDWNKAGERIVAHLKHGYTEAQILDGARRYAAMIRANGTEGTEFVKQAATFVGPGRHFLDDFEIAKGRTHGDVMREAIEDFAGDAGHGRVGENGIRRVNDLGNDVREGGHIGRRKAQDAPQVLLGGAEGGKAGVD